MEGTELSNREFLCNPDVILREEDESGALLFNPDTNHVKVVNPTGIFIWKQFTKPNQLSSVVKAINADFDNVPEKQVREDVEEFLVTMIAHEFIGLVVDEG